jgi:hypothetical protein
MKKPLPQLYISNFLTKCCSITAYPHTRSPNFFSSAIMNFGPQLFKENADSQLHIRNSPNFFLKSPELQARNFLKKNIP